MASKRRSEAKDYAVGFAKPPSAHKFAPGISGNPRGRPKGSANLASVLERTLREKVVVNEGGRRKTLSKLEAAMKQLINKAATGDHAAIKLLVQLASALQEQAELTTPAPRVLGETDQKVMQGMLKRLARTQKGGQSDAADN